MGNKGQLLWGIKIQGHACRPSLPSPPQAYSVCHPGGAEDASSILGQIVKGRNLERAIAPRALDQEPRLALRVGGGQIAHYWLKGPLKG